MLRTRRTYQHRAVEQTDTEREMGRILPPDREDLSVDDTGVYSLSIMGQHTVAGVAVARRRRRGQGADEAAAAAKHAQAADEAARQARGHARAAVRAAGQAGRHAQRADEAALAARRQARQRQGRSEVPGGASEELAHRVRGAIGPHATVEELLKARAALVSRVS